MPDRSDIGAALDRFYALGLAPRLSVDGSIADADVEVRRGARVQGQTVPILDVQVTARGLAKLEAAK